jgi:hypothetical protein
MFEKKFDNLKSIPVAEPHSYPGSSRRPGDSYFRRRNAVALNDEPSRPRDRPRAPIKRHLPQRHRRRPRQVKRAIGHPLGAGMSRSLFHRVGVFRRFNGRAADNFFVSKHFVCLSVGDVHYNYFCELPDCCHHLIDLLHSGHQSFPSCFGTGNEFLNASAAFSFPKPAGFRKMI